MENFAGALLATLIPVIGLIGIMILKNPRLLFYLLFVINYFILGINRYHTIEGVSVLIDILIFSMLVILMIHSYLYQSITWSNLKNPLVIGMICWAIYCGLEIANPTASFEGWVLSRTLILNGLLIALLANILLTEYRHLRILFILFAVFTILAIIKTLTQRYIGFDYAEQRWLSEGGAKTHIIQAGVRYFSFFTDAGNLGSNMGAASILFGIIGFYCKNKGYKIILYALCIAASYAMLLSGTRGAIIVPLAGIALFTLISKKFTLMITSGFLLLSIYVFFAFTHIGQDNANIRRMRSAFSPTEDASFNVRKDNQQKLATYLKNRPFGEGLGLSGVENQRISHRYTTSIPTDSWYVKIWVETGIVGLILYISILFVTFAYAGYQIMFQISDTELRGYLTGLLCAIFGLSISAYGNAFWGQFPTHILVFTGMAILMNARTIDKQLAYDKNITL
ncbi:MAG: O-antigen ligase family protein [Bacteroidales bacterium]